MVWVFDPLGQELGDIVDESEFERNEVILEINDVEAFAVFEPPWIEDDGRDDNVVDMDAVTEGVFEDVRDALTEGVAEAAFDEVNTAVPDTVKVEICENESDKVPVTVPLPVCVRDPLEDADGERELNEDTDT